MPKKEGPAGATGGPGHRRERRGGESPRPDHPVVALAAELAQHLSPSSSHLSAMVEVALVSRSRGACDALVQILRGNDDGFTAYIRAIEGDSNVEKV